MYLPLLQGTVLLRLIVVTLNELCILIHSIIITRLNNEYKILTQITLNK